MADKKKTLSSTKVYIEDHKKLRTMAFNRETTIVELMSEIAVLLKKDKKAKPLEQKENSEYKSVRIYADDLKELKEMAFKRDTTIVDLVSAAVQVLENQGKQA